MLWCTCWGMYVWLHTTIARHRLGSVLAVPCSFGEPNLHVAYRSLDKHFNNPQACVHLHLALHALRIQSC